MNRYILLVLMQIFSFCTLASEIEPVGNYSSMELTKEESDLLGYRLIIVDAKNGYKGIFQYAEGKPSDPQIVDVEIIGGKIKFNVADGYIDATFLGEISSTSIRGNFYKNEKVVYDEKKIILKREPDYRECKGVKRGKAAQGK